MFSRALTEIFVVLAISLLAVNSQTTAVNYENQPNWTGLCTLGKEQSPIDFSSTIKYLNDEGVFEIVDIDYPTIKSFTATLLEGKYVGFSTVGNMGSIVVEIKDRLKVRYNLAGVYLHAESEHTIKGEKYEAEMHLYHVIDEPYFMAQNPGYISEFKDLETNLVIALLLDAGASDNEEIAELKIGTNQSIVDFEIEKLISHDMKFYHYQGSSTTPPCTESVYWVVKAEPVKFSNAQLDVITKIQKDAGYANGNDRNIQPLNNRPVYYSSSAYLGFTFTLLAVLFTLFF